MRLLFCFFICAPSLVESYAADHKGPAHKGPELCKFLPENDLYIGPDVKTFNSIDQSTFNSLLSEVETVYAPIVRSKGGALVVKRLWDNGEVNARAYRQGNQHVIEMYGGLARHPLVTRDAVALVACHEVGHHLGGAPKYSDAQGSWASVEGQSDYFAVMKCLRKVFKKYPQNVGSDPIVSRECARHTDPEAAQICVRASLAGQAMAKAMAQMSGAVEPRLDLKDPRRVTQTNERHPEAQCRLDTYFQGSLCSVSDTVDFENNSVTKGACSNSGADSFGGRPLCWFKPTGAVGPTPTTTPTPTPPQPTVAPPPVASVAKVPGLNGLSDLQITDLRRAVNITWDVQNFPGSAGVYLEFSRPNQAFRNPNSTVIDANALGGSAHAGRRGQVTIVPAQNLPAWGVYQIRVIPLDQTGRNPLGRFSNPARLNLSPTRYFN